MSVTDRVQDYGGGIRVSIGNFRFAWAFPFCRGKRKLLRQNPGRYIRDICRGKNSSRTTFNRVIILVICRGKVLFAGLFATANLHLPGFLPRQMECAAATT